jgi:hypothetical protein
LFAERTTKTLALKLVFLSGELTEAFRRHVRLWQILLRKSVGCDGRSTNPFGVAGSDPPALTPSTQLQRYAKHKA